ncbi:MAG: hypothetical protein HC841_03435 [Verrucomicrobiae bacterium]|nr:hypothetical protein [Verrucomicrobiae bacterium]
MGNSPGEGALEFRGHPGNDPRMSTVGEIESAVRQLPVEQARELQDWLADYLEDEAELSPEFLASIERGREDLAAGRVRRA